MPIPTELDDLERQIVRLEEEIRRRKNRIVQLNNDVAEARNYVERCRISCKLCLENIADLKQKEIIPLADYRDMIKLYEDNCDFLIQYTIAVNRGISELNGIKEQMPSLEESLKKSKKRLTQWGIVIPLRRK
jgi:chromosome segregation ATPase